MIPRRILRRKQLVAIAAGSNDARSTPDMAAVATGTGTPNRAAGDESAGYAWT